MTDRQTDRHTTTACATLAWRRAVKTDAAEYIESFVTLGELSMNVGYKQRTIVPQISSVCGVLLNCLVGQHGSSRES